MLADIYTRLQLKIILLTMLVNWADLDAIRTEAHAVAAAAPVMRAGAVLQAEDQNWTTGVIGTSPDYLQIRKGSAHDQSPGPHQTPRTAC